MMKLKKNELKKEPRKIKLSQTGSTFHTYNSGHEIEIIS